MAYLPARFLIPALMLCLPAVSFAYEGDPVTNAIRALAHPASASARPAGASAFYFAGGLLGTGALVYSFDGRIRHMARKNRTASLDSISRQAEKIGNGGYELALLGAFAGAGCAFRNDKLTDTALLAAESFLAANAVGTALKYSAGRSRPYGENGKRSFRPFSFRTVRTSFPSGHTTSAFSVASVLASRYDSIWAGLAAYGAASAAAFQRVYSDKHWASDVFAGAVLGTVTGRMVVRGAAGRPAKSVYLVPVVGPDLSGALAALRF